MSGISLIPTLDLVLERGNTSDRYVVIEGSITTLNAASEDRTIASGYTHTHANLTVGNGRTYTVSSGGWLIALEALVITGTGVVIVTGDSRVI